MDEQPGDWISRLSDAQLQARVGTPTFFRGRQYGEQGRVRGITVGDDGGLVGVVAGSGSHVYRIVVEPPTGGRGWDALCSCPVGIECKHIVAVLLGARDRLTRTSARPSWEAALAGLVVSPVVSDSARQPLALEFSVASPARGLAPSIHLRPLRRGKRDEWVRSGATWGDLGNAWGATDLDPRQRSLLTQLHRLAGSSPTGYGAPATLNLADLGSLVWPLLRRVEEADVQLLAGDGLRSVALGDDAASVTLEVSPHDGGLRVAARASVVNPEAPGRLFLVGNPAHGLGHLNAGDLVLWPVDDLIPDPVAAFVDDNRAAEVPAGEVNRFLTMYYPALARTGVLTSPAGTLDLPDVLPPHLHLTLAHDETRAVELRWGFAYPAIVAGAEAVVVPLRAGRDDPPRDAVTERGLLAGIAPVLDAAPADVVLRGMDAATFLTKTLADLTAAGVEVAESGDPVHYEQATEAPVVTVAADDSVHRDWFDLHVTVTVDGQQVPFDQLFSALAAGDDALILDSGTWFPLDIPELQTLRQLIEEARELIDDESGPLRISPFQTALWDELVELGVVARQSARWRDAVAELLPDAERPPVADLPGLHADLRPYQVTGVQWLSALWDAGLGGILADDMGLGKTLQTLALAERARMAGQLDGRPILVVAPASVVGTWVDEAARFAPELRVVAITSTGKKRDADLPTSVEGAHLVVTSYTLLRLEDTEYRALPWSGLVLDEAQFVKNHRSRTYQAARRIGAPFTLAITGTPLENSLMDLWSMLSLSAPGLFPRPDKFTERYRKPIENDRDPVALETLRRRMRPFVLRRTKREVARELPDKIEQVLRLDLAPAHRRIYDKHLQRERQRVLGMLDDLNRNRVQIFRALTMLRQLSLDPVLVDPEHATGVRSAKVESLVEQVSELASEGHRALVFSSFTGYLGQVRKALTEEGISYTYLDGRTRDRQAVIKEFRDGTAPVFLISLKAGGSGLTLTEADYVFVLDPWWNPAAENQAIDRAHRIGQTRAVNVYRMVSADTIEEKVVALQARKRDLFSSVVDDGEFTSGALTAADIRGLFEE